MQIAGALAKVFDVITQLAVTMRAEWRGDIQKLAPPNIQGVVTSVNSDNTVGVRMQGTQTPVNLKAHAGYSDPTVGHVVTIIHVSGEPTILDRLS